MIAGMKTPSTSLRSQHGRDRIEAAGERLADDHHVGRDAFVHVGEELAGAAEAGLDFVGHEAGRRFCGRWPTASFEETRGRNDDAGLALNRLDQEGAGVGRDGCAQRVGVAEGDDLEAGSERAEAVAVLLVGREADDGDGAAVEVVGADDDLGLAVGNAFDLVAPLARGLDRGLDGLGAGVHGQRHVEAGEVVQFFVEQRQLVVAEGARGQRDLAGLLDQASRESWDGSVPG